MNNLFRTALKLLIFSVLLVNLTFIQGGRYSSASAWFETLKPYLTILMIVTALAAIILMFTKTSTFAVRMVLILITLAVLFPLYYPLIAGVLPSLSRLLF